MGEGVGRANAQRAHILRFFSDTQVAHFFGILRPHAPA